MDDRPFQGILLGSALGLILWIVVALVSLHVVGYLPRVPTFLWWVLGFLLICGAGVVARTFPRRGLAIVPSQKPWPSGEDPTQAAGSHPLLALSPARGRPHGHGGPLPQRPR